MAHMRIAIGAASLAVFLPTTNAQDVYTSATVSTDRATRVPAAGVLMEWDTSDPQKASFTTNKDGNAGSAVIPAFTPVVFTLGEARTSLGSTVGQVFVKETACSADRATNVFQWYVPEARTYRFRGLLDEADPEFTTRDEYGRQWYSMSFDNSSAPVYDFTASVATFTAPETIDAYFTYQGAAVPDSYTHGILIRTAESVDLGADALVFALSQLGHNYSVAQLDVFNFTDSTDPGTVAALDSVDIESGYTFATVGEGLPRGDTLLLIRETAGPGSTTVLPDEPVTIPPPSGGGGLSSGSLEDSSQTESQSKYRSEKVAAIRLLPSRHPLLATVPSSESSATSFKPCKKEDADTPDKATYCSATIGDSDFTPPESECDPPNDAPGQSQGAAECTQTIVCATEGVPPCNSSGISTSEQICFSVEAHVGLSVTLKKVVEIQGGVAVGATYCKEFSLAECKCVFHWLCVQRCEKKYTMCVRERRLRKHPDAGFGRYYWVNVLNATHIEVKEDTSAIWPPTTCVPTGGGC